MLLVAGFIAPYKPANLLKTFLPQVDQLNEQREISLRRLEGLADRIIVRADEDRRAARVRLDEESERLRSEHTSERQKLQSEFDQQAEALKQRATELDARARELDDRGNTHARRQLQRDLKNELKNRSTSFSLTKDTASKRHPINVAFFGLFVALAALVGWTFWSTAQAPPANIPFWFPLLRFAASVTGLIGSVIFYIRWQDRWSQSHIDEEFRLKRLDLDIDRAAWLVEMLLEWKAEKESDIPKELIDKLGTGLFEQMSPGATIRHPVEDAVTALLSSSSTIKIPFAGGGEAVLDRKSMKEADDKTKPK